MVKHPIALLGVPFLNCSLEEIVAKCLELIFNPPPYPPRSHYAAAITAGDIAAAHAWEISLVKNPELLQTYRNTNIAVPTGKALILLSRLLGSPIQEDISAEQLLACLALELGKRERGIFLLGTSDKLSKSAAIRLHDKSPGLLIVGVASPSIYFEGEDLVSAPARDDLVIEQINASNADLLAINVESPKNAIWFGRIQRYIKTPLAMGIPGTFDGHETESAEHQKGPSKLWRRCLTGTKFAWLAVPLVIYHNLNRLAFTLFNKGKASCEPPRHSLLFLSPQRTIAVIVLPSLIDKTNTASLLNYFEEAANHDILVLDFRWVRHIQPEGFGLLIAMWEHRNKEKREFYGFSPTWRIKQLIRMHRTWDLLKSHICFSTEMLIARLSHGGASAFFDSIYQQGPLVIINFFGVLSNHLDYETYLKTLMPVLEQKDCAIDLSYCTFVSNRAFSFLLNMQKMLQDHGNSLTLCSLTKNVKEQFRTARLERIFHIVKNVQMIG
jgi:exopolysaccharide biosynthesis WecB/TagA/CpsF family protein/anti-anti-sigma factor